eukprot:2046012-Karenia_brevis.AAC.1
MFGELVTALAELGLEIEKKSDKSCIMELTPTGTDEEDTEVMEDTDITSTCEVAGITLKKQNFLKVVGS